MDKSEVEKIARELDKELHIKCYLRDKDKDDVDRIIKEQVYAVLKDRDLTKSEIDAMASAIAPIIDLAVSAKTQTMSETLKSHDTYIKIMWFLVGGSLIAGISALISQLFRFL